MPEQRHVKLFRNGRNQAVRIAVEFELPGDEAIMHRDGDRLVIEQVRKRGLVALLKTMKPLEEDGSPRLLKAVEDLLGEIEVLPFEVPADAKYGGIRSELEAAGKPIRGNDLLIAAHAYATGATIVTANSGEFKRIRGLNVENWLA
ncbi:PIN domain-containing protein [Bradyrhizobium sp. Ash2021]|uniref:PIN domain-containing protein n=1 Tax=Bradyrhizobium sp. Ash2021 TaxID=2954771 RepID=UPI0028158DC9|nr:PIN domain-containing protein [Bradyrhizobium sp. Ash2021]WMT74357.1 PIN domain-containing protein [Bradyrhizobium sp. Ash2021]